MGLAWYGKRSRRIAALAAALAALGWAGGAGAAISSCDGTYSATLLHKLPTPMVVGLDVRDDSPANQRMAQRFLAGLREAGVTVGASPNVVLQISSRIRRGTPGAKEAGESDNSGQSDMAGGLQPVGPEFSSDTSRTPEPLLSLRIEAAAGPDKQVAWWAAVQCKNPRQRRRPARAGYRPRDRRGNRAAGGERAAVSVFSASHRMHRLGLGWIAAGSLTGHDGQKRTFDLWPGADWRLRHTKPARQTQVM